MIMLMLFWWWWHFLSWRMLGILTFLDPPRPDTKQTIEDSGKLGVEVSGCFRPPPDPVRGCCGQIFTAQCSG